MIKDTRTCFKNCVLIKENKTSTTINNNTGHHTKKKTPKLCLQRINSHLVKESPQQSHSPVVSSLSGLPLPWLLLKGMAGGSPGCKNI